MITSDMVSNVTEKFRKLGWKPEDDWWYHPGEGAVYLIPEDEDIEVGTIEELAEMSDHEFAFHVATHNVTRRELMERIAHLEEELASYTL